MIEVTVEVDLDREGGPVEPSDVTACLEQCRRDAVDGSFGQYPLPIRALVRQPVALLNDRPPEKFGDHSHVEFQLGLPETLFPIAHGGLQLLVGLLAGDMFPSKVNDIRWSNTRVVELELPEAFERELEQRFRGERAHTIGSVRAAFDLQPDEPLVAFSFKPRFGLGFEDIRRITLGVLEAGFHLVEMDTRQLALGVAPLDQWIELGAEAAEAGKHKTAFSPNLSHLGPATVEAVTRWHAAISDAGPSVVKIDGGLDSLSAVQAIRLADFGDLPPIVTCYPLLRTHLSSAVGADGWVDLLALSGVDVIYPGGRPSFADEARPIWPETWSRAASKYDRRLRRGWPMPTVAGGVHPGQLHAHFELLGPKVAYFLGGAVALHPEGPEEGARLCVDVLKGAIQRTTAAALDGAPWSDDLPKKLLERVEGTSYPARFNYTSPSEVFKETSENRLPAEPFYRRDLP